MLKSEIKKRFPFLDSHQIDGIEWITKDKNNVYLAHAPGAGKTAQAIIASQSWVPGRPIYSLFIVPPTLTKNWEREILKWSEIAGFNWPIIATVPRSLHKDKMDWTADFIICPDSMLTADWVLAAFEKLKYKIEFIAVDEASRFKEIKSQRSNIFYGKIVDWFREAKIVFIDGSPMPNRPMELWAPAYYLDAVSINWRDRHQFGMKFCAGEFVQDRYHSGYEYKGASNQEELKKSLQHRFMHVVNESDLSHPERLRKMVFVNSDVRTASMKKWEEKNAGKFKMDSEENSMGELAKHRQLIGLKKVPFIIQYVKERLEKNEQESIIVFVWHVEVGRELARRLGDCPFVSGATNGKDREWIFKSFQSGRARVLIGNIAAMGRGHNLQRANRVVFAEFSWTDELNKQAEKRASRKGSNHKSVACDYIVAPNSVDEMVLRSLFTKAKNVERIIG